tara:strand:+ start:552 stop:800 length:249 start_codon:yes stop_codon:yes gene_type:complete
MSKDDLIYHCTALVGQVGYFIEKFFYWCVDVLVWIGDVTGLGYMLANILIFVILQPSLILLFIFLWLKERRKNESNINKRRI